MVLALIDISTLSDTTHIFRVQHLLDIYDSGEDLVRHQDWHIAEWVVWNELHAKSDHVPFENLLNNGLRQMVPGILNHPNALQTNVKTLRGYLLHWAPAVEKKRSKNAAEAATQPLKVARCFGKEWRFIVFVIGLSLCGRDFTDSSIVSIAMRTINSKSAIAIHLHC